MKANVILFTGKKVKERFEGGKLVYFEYPLMLKLSNGKNDRKHISLGVSLPASRWHNGQYKDLPVSRYMAPEEVADIKSQNAKIRSLISDIETRYNKKIRELVIEGKSVSTETLYQMIEKPVNTEYRLVLQWMEKLRDDFRAVDRIGQSRVYDDARRMLSLFLKGKDIAFDEVDLAMLYRYEHFLKQRKIKVHGTNDSYTQLKNSSVSIYMRTLRASIAKAVKLGHSKKQAFLEYSIPKGKSNKRALSIPEIEAVLNSDKVNKTTDHYRYTAFSYFTIGMNFTDIARLTWNDIRGNEIHYTRQKIHQKLIIPVHPKVREILDYYKPITGKTMSITGANDNYIFPILQKEIHITESQKENRIRKVLKEFNKELKVIGASAKVDTVLTSYVLRHTAITNLVRLGITADAIQALAGHKRLTTTENYIKEASQEVKSKAVNML
jgi:integrase